MENLTVGQLAEKLDIQKASLVRKLKRWNEKGVIEQSYGLNDLLPAEVIELLQSENNLTTTTTTTRKFIEETTTSRSAARNEMQVRRSTPNSATAPVIIQAPAQPKGINFLYVAAATILVSTDAVSCGWIAWNAFHEFQLIAALFFGLAGVAVGYAAIQIIVKYQGFSADSYAWGFGAFQVGLHLCAMEVFGTEWSYFIGKIMIAFSLAIATNAIAEAIKAANKK